MADTILVMSLLYFSYPQYNYGLQNNTEVFNYPIVNNPITNNCYRYKYSTQFCLVLYLSLDMLPRTVFSVQTRSSALNNNIT